MKPARWKSRSIARQISRRSNTDALVSSSNGAYWLIIFNRCNRSSLLNWFLLRPLSSSSSLGRWCGSILAKSGCNPVSALDKLSHLSATLYAKTFFADSRRSHARRFLSRLLFRHAKRAIRDSQIFSSQCVLVMPRMDERLKMLDPRRRWKRTKKETCRRFDFIEDPYILTTLRNPSSRLYFYVCPRMK